MRTGKKGTDWARLWKRNAVVAAIALFVCAAVYLNWNYEQEAEAGKTLGQSTMVGSETNDPLVSGTGTEQDGDAQTGGVESGDVETDAQSQTATTSGDYFATARLNRQQARDSAISLLEDAAQQEDADQSVANQASESIQVLASYTLKEAQIENLVTAKGYADCVAFMGDDSLSIVVSKEDGTLDASDVAKITDIAMTETGYAASAIRIMAAN